MIGLQQALSENPLIAILRGLEPSQSVSVSDILTEAGFKIIEVPLNSPNALDSIEKISARHGTNAVVGAGTVLSAKDVAEVAEAGGRIIVSPNMNPEVGKAAIERGMFWCPGVMTPTEAFSALEIGASILKFFPAEMVPPKAISAMRAVLPKEAVVAAVGGITPENMADYRTAGADSFGLGSALFKPTYTTSEIQERAQKFMNKWRSLQ